MYKSIDLHIDKNSKNTLFLKRTKINIYNIFLDLEDEVLKKEKFEHQKIEFHLILEEEEIHFIKYMKYKGGRTIFSCMKEMINFLIDWNVDGMGHFCVCVEE